jgi:hypothetical protein
MALHPTIVAHLPARIVEQPYIPEHRDNPYDLAPQFWRIAIPACLLFWAAIAYAIHSAI